MPQSSVYLRLQWPSSSSSESSHEISSVPSSSSSVDASPLIGVERISLREISFREKNSSSEIDEAADAHEMVPMNRSRSFGTLHWKDYDSSSCKEKSEKAKLRKRSEETKSRRLVRSMCNTSTASTSTDPEDFFYACSIANYQSALPPHLKELSSRIIIPTKDKPASDSKLLTQVDCKSSEDIPYIDTKEDDQEIEHTHSKHNSFSHTSLLSKIKERTLFVLPKKYSKVSHHFMDHRTCEPPNEHLSTLEEVTEEENIPDLLSDCKFNSDCGFENLHEEQKSEDPNVLKPKEEYQRSLKKTVKFLLPPLYCDSFALEEQESLSGEYPPSGYAELDGGLLPPNGGDPYRNSPSPGIHGVPNDRYVDGVYEGEPFMGDFTEDGGFQVRSQEIENYSREREEDSFRSGEEYRRIDSEGADGGYASTREMEQYQMGEGDMYGQLKQSERNYSLNGGLSSAHHNSHLIHSYEDEGPQGTPIATTPLAHPSPQIITPLLPPHASGPPTPSHNHHDTYAPASLLRSPSADSTSRVRWRDPDLHEVIDFLSNPNNIVKANAAAYLQHLCYMDDATKQKTRILGGIPPLVALLSHDLPELHRNACGALRNLSYGRQNDENKRAIKDAGGLPSLVRLLRKTLDNEVKELVTGILWNLSSCEDLKQCILDEALGVLVSHVIIPCSGWDGGEVERDPNNDVWWSTVFKNASGIIRNISSAGEYARTKLRHCPGLVDSLFCVIKLAIQGNSHDNKSVENCVCILRNLSYRCQEVEDPNYDKHQPPTQSRATATGKEGEEDGSDKCGDNLGCFGGSRKKKEMVGGQLKDLESGQRSSGPRGQPVRGMELLWQPELVVQPYLALLSDCNNPETLEAAAGALQNLAACYWQPSIDVRAAVRKEKGLPILVELLRMDVDRVVCAVATALRNLAIDQRNKELIGKYAMRDLVQKLPSQNAHDVATSDETIAAVLATLNEVIKKNAEFSRSLLDAGGVERLVFVTRQRGRYSTRVVKFASQVLFSMWGHQELREVYKKAGWKEQDFVSKSVAARNAAGGANSPTANNTLNRPMASQGGTRYEDRTIQRSNNQNKHHQYQRREEVPLADLGYGGGDGGGAPGGVRIYGPLQGKPGEPVYAKVNRDKKRNRQYDSGGLFVATGDDWGEAPPAYTAIHQAPTSSNYSEPHLIMNPMLADAANNNEIPLIGNSEPAGDSWV